MKRKDIKALHQKSVTELREDLDKKRKELKKIEIEKKVKKLKNNRLLQTLRDDLARIATIIKEVDLKEKHEPSSQDAMLRVNKRGRTK